MLLLLLLVMLLPPSDGQAQIVSGQKKNGSCVCAVDSKLWSFPALEYEAALQQMDVCGTSLSSLQEQVQLSNQRLPQMEALLNNLTARLEPFQYLHDRGLYTTLSLRLLGEELDQLETDVSSVQSQLNNTHTRKLSKEVGKLRTDVSRMHMSDTINMKTVKERLRYLKNTAESCKSIPKDFRGQSAHCLKGLMSNISSPVVTRVSPLGKNYQSGSWGKQAQENSSEQKNSYWVQALTNSDHFGNYVRIYQTYEDFMASINAKDFTIAPSFTHANTIQGPSAVLYGDAFYYHCYRSPEICRFDLKSNTVKRVKLPGTGVGATDTFPYCYYECRRFSDIDVEVDETGLWAIYATAGNHGNMVVSRLVWDSDAETLNVTQTWETRMFKKAVSNAFMVCGVLYATRNAGDFQEEVFYAFDTASGKEDNTLALPLEKVSKGIAGLSYNPTNKQIYMYNDGYLLSYQAEF
ncbi:uncharacterized protein V6R79_022193 [Siganus canaliculatus]